jgi:hypothetical protein
LISIKRRLWNLVWSADSLHNPKNSNSILIWRMISLSLSLQRIFNYS